MKNYKNFPKQSCNYLRSLAYSLIEAATAAAKSLQSCLTLCNPIDGSPPGSPVLGFSRQEHWSGLPFPSPMHESEREVTQSCPTLCDPMGCSLPGSSIHGIFQAGVLESFQSERSVFRGRTRVRRGFLRKWHLNWVPKWEVNSREDIQDVQR